jgi:hypothetical protein
MRFNHHRALALLIERDLSENRSAFSAYAAVPVRIMLQLRHPHVFYTRVMSPAYEDFPIC